MTSVDKIIDFGVRSVWIHIPIQPDNSCMTLDKTILCDCFSTYGKCNNITTLQDIAMINYIIECKMLSTVLRMFFKWLVNISFCIINNNKHKSLIDIDFAFTNKLKTKSMVSTNKIRFYGINVCLLP